MDLAPLYGNSKKTLDKLRVHDGRGLLHPDTFAEDRLLLLPPQVCVLLVLFNRNHNVSLRLVVCAYIQSKQLVVHRRQAVPLRTIEYT